MIRKHEISDSIRAGFYALSVHAILLVAMLISFNWKAAHPVMNVTEVELWDKLPAPKSINTPKPEPVIKEEPKPEPKLEPKPIVKEEPKPEPKPEEPKVDIELEKKKKELEHKKELELKKEKERKEKLAKQKKLEALQAATREEALKDKAAEQAQKEALEKLQQEALAEAKGREDKAASAANASLIGEYIAKIRAKVTGNVNKTLCGDDNLEVIFAVSVLPTGELSGNPKLLKSSGNSACDEAAERAIIVSEPLPLPSDPALFTQFRDLELKFKPNE